MKRLPVIASFLLFLMLCASITYWLLQWMAPSTRPLIVPMPVERALPEMSAAANLFGGNAEAISAISVQLSGIIMANRGADSVAIIALPGKPARSLHVNAEVIEGLVVKKINSRSVVLSERGVDREVRLPEFAAGP
jgi:general secretion pathway protein C